MDSSTFFTLAIGGIVIFVWGYDRVKALFRHGTPEASATPEAIAEAAAQATPEHPLGSRDWLDYVNLQPDTIPHLFVVGPTRAGKTTLSRAILSERRGQFVIMTAKTKADWPGLPVIATRGGTTVDEARAMFLALHDELNRRMEAIDAGRFTSDELTIVLDDYAALRIDCGEDIADDAVMRIARLGASIRMRLIVITDTTLVEAIGFKGLGEARNHFVSLYPTRRRTATIGIQSDTERGANGRLKETLVPIAIEHVMAMAGRQINPRRCWQPPRDPEMELEALHAAWTGERTNERTNERPISAEKPHNERTNGAMLASLGGDQLRRAIVELLVNEGLNTTQIRDHVKGEARAIGDLVQTIKQGES